MPIHAARGALGLDSQLRGRGVGVLLIVVGARLGQLHLQLQRQRQREQTCQRRAVVVFTRPIGAASLTAQQLDTSSGTRASLPNNPSAAERQPGEQQKRPRTCSTLDRRTLSFPLFVRAGCTSTMTSTLARRALDFFPSGAEVVAVGFGGSGATCELAPQPILPPPGGLANRRSARVDRNHVLHTRRLFSRKLGNSTAIRRGRSWRLSGRWVLKSTAAAEGITAKDYGRRERATSAHTAHGLALKTLSTPVELTRPKRVIVIPSLEIDL